MGIILGVESTAHTFGVGIVEHGKILANVRDSYTTEKGGIVPLEAARHHALVNQEVLQKALVLAGISLEKVDAIAFSQGPGLAPCLLEGLKLVKKLSSDFQKPVIPINHCVAHLEIGKITGAKDPVLLYASGANTQIIAYASGKYRIFGETLDLGIGNCIDTFARDADLGFPGVPKIAEIALKGETYVELPYSIKGMDVAFSGLLTNLKQKLESKKYSLEDLSYSLQETAFSLLVEAAERALAHTGKKELVLGGGVACNKRFQEMCKIMCFERGATFFVPENSLLVDNGAMIAYAGEMMFKKGIFVALEQVRLLDILPRQRTDEVEISYL